QAYGTAQPAVFNEMLRAARKKLSHEEYQALGKMLGILPRSHSEQYKFNEELEARACAQMVAYFQRQIRGPPQRIAANRNRPYTLAEMVSLSEKSKYPWSLLPVGLVEFVDSNIPCAEIGKGNSVLRNVRNTLLHLTGPPFNTPLYS